MVIVMSCPLLDWIGHRSILYRSILRPEGGGGCEHHFFSFHICDRAAEDKQVEKTGSKSDCAFLRYCMSKFTCN